MKKNTLLVAFTAICCIVLPHCSKKDSPIDYAASFKNSVWTGELKYDFRTKNEPFSVVLSADGKIEWYEFNGKNTGSYQVNNDKKEVTFTFSSGNSFTASIKNDSTLGDFKNNGAYNREIRSARLHNYARNFNSQSLIGTIWYGSVQEAGLQFQMTVQNSQTLVYATGSSFPGIQPYSAGPATLSFSYGSLILNFGVILSDKKIVGVRTKSGTNDVLSWEAKRL